MDLRSYEEIEYMLRRFIPRGFAASSQEPPPSINSMIQMNEELWHASSFIAGQHRKMEARFNDPLSRSLPPEIISRIFELSVSHPRSLDTGLIRNLKDIFPDSPLKLGAVCVAWRSIAWATPRLWTYIAVRLDVTRFPTRAIVALEWLQRTGSLPLYISLTTNKPGESIFPGSWSDEFNPLIETINRLSHRWRVLHLELPVNFIQHIRPTSTSNITSGLHTLRVLSPEVLLPPAQGGQIEQTFVAPNLAPLAVQVSELPFQSMKFQYHQLTALTLHTLSISKFIELIITAPRLVNYFVDTVEESLEPPTQLSHYGVHRVHSALETLRFGCESLDGLTTIFNTFDFPALQRLELLYRGERVPGNLTSCIQRSNCSLKYLSISVAGSDWNDIFSLLHAVPSLERLDLEDFPLATRQETNEIVKHFAMHCCDGMEPECEEKGAFLPNLRRVCLSDYTGNSHDQDWTLVLKGLDRLIDEFHHHNCHQDFHHQVHQRNRDFHKLDLSLAVIVDVTETLQYIQKDIIPRFISILERGIALEVTGEIVESEDQIPKMVDVIEESMRAHEFSKYDIDKYIALAKSREFMDEWESDLDLK